MSKASWLIRDKEFYKRLFLLALPLAGQSILTFSVNLADNIMVGQLGDTAISGVYMANQWNNLLQKFVQGFCTASLVIATQYWGRRDTDSEVLFDRRYGLLLDGVCISRVAAGYVYHRSGGY